MFDLNQFNTQTASDVAKTMTLVDPFTGNVARDANGDTITFQVLGMQSTVARNAMNANSRKKSKSQEQDGAELLASLTTGWSDNVGLKGKKLPYSFDNAVELYLALDSVARQVLSFASDLANYEPKK